MNLDFVSIITFKFGWWNSSEILFDYRLQ